MNLPNNMFPSPYGTINSILWVNGIEGAKAFQMMPNSNAVLMDSQNDGVMYVKTIDGVGMSNIRVFHYEEVKPVKEEYVSKADFDRLMKRVEELTNGKSTVQSAKSKTTGADN